MTLDNRWPTARLDNIARLRVLAAGLPGVHLHEQRIDAEFGEVWAFLSDLERTTPLFDSDVQSLRVLRRDDEQLRIRVRLPRWLASAPMDLDVTLRDGWCWMISRPQVYVIGMAAEPTTDGSGATVLAHMEGMVLPTPRLGWAAAPLLAVSRWRHRLHVPRDVARLAAQITR